MYAVLFLSLLFVVPFAHASLFGDFIGKITGKSVSSDNWTAWYNDDTPEGSGDYEDINILRVKHPEICKKPIDVECRTNTSLDSSSSGEKVICDKNVGVYCVNAEQTDAKCNYDYEVRFNCGEEDFPEPPCLGDSCGKSPEENKNFWNKVADFFGRIFSTSSNSDNSGNNVSVVIQDDEKPNPVFDSNNDGTNGGTSSSESSDNSVGKPSALSNEPVQIDSSLPPETTIITTTQDNVAVLDVNEGNKITTIKDNIVDNLIFYTNVKAMKISVSSEYQKISKNIYIEPVGKQLSPINLGIVETEKSIILADTEYLNKFTEICSSGSGEKINFVIALNESYFVYDEQGVSCQTYEEPKNPNVVLDYSKGGLVTESFYEVELSSFVDETQIKKSVTQKRVYPKYFKDGVWKDYDKIVSPDTLCKEIWGDDFSAIRTSNYEYYGKYKTEDGNYENSYVSMQACSKGGASIPVWEFTQASFSLMNTYQNSYINAYPGQTLQAHYEGSGNSFKIESINPQVCEATIENTKNYLYNAKITTKSQGTCVVYIRDSLNHAKFIQINVMNPEISITPSHEPTGVSSIDSIPEYSSSSDYAKINSKYNIWLEQTFDDRQKKDPFSATYSIKSKKIYGAYMISVYGNVIINGKDTGIKIPSVIKGNIPGYVFTDRAASVGIHLSPEQVKQYAIDGRNKITFPFYVYNYAENKWYGPFKFEKEFDYLDLSNYQCSSSILSIKNSQGTFVQQGVLHNYNCKTDKYSVSCRVNSLGYNYCDIACNKESGKCVTMTEEEYRAKEDTYPTCDLSDYDTCSLTTYPLLVSGFSYTQSTGFSLTVRNAGEYSEDLSNYEFLIPDVDTGTKDYVIKKLSGKIYPTFGGHSIRTPVNHDNYEKICCGQFKVAILKDGKIVSTHTQKPRCDSVTCN